ncbi:hypothetical protein BGZ60DRAFT_535825 [Tricladium varicosporioides]|nr:hypothetical protein BGZ60DRAFT_535825 [Hymenoscyphus varicosporioides]
MQILLFSFLLALTTSPVSAHPTELAVRQSISKESARLVIDHLEKNGLDLDNIFEKRDSVITKHQPLSNDSISVLIDTIKLNKINFDLNRLKSRPLSESTTKELIAAIEATGFKIDLSILNKRDDTVSDLSSRTNLLPNKMPDCTPDPANNIPYSGTYKIGQGTKVEKRDPNGVDACDTKGSKVWCWTEQYLVETSIEYSEWEPTGFSIDCAKSNSCSTTTVALGQSCVTHTSGAEHGFEANIENKFEFTVFKKKWTLGVSPKYSYKHSSSKSDTICTAESSQATCNWNDQKCHSTWVAQHNARLYGYLQRTCASDVPAVVQQAKGTKDAAGHTVLGIMDYSFLTPLDKIVGCAAACGDQIYPDPIPVDGSPRIPYELA